jgi:hypothetical protein
LISSGLKHYPQIKFQGDEKMLWNPVLKKSYKNRPEERVRLQFVDFLIFEAGFSKNKIAFESPVSLPGDKSASRSDVICYDEDFKPLLLVECKAPSIQLDEKTAIQIARYNSEIDAPFLMVTNGLRDFWFESSGNEITFLENPTTRFSSTTETKRNFEYWQGRGFAGSIEEPIVQQWITENCNQLLVQTSNPAHFIDFEGTEPDLQLSNFYQILLINEQTRLAVSLTSTPFGATKFNAILNQGGQNVGLLSASLDIIASDQLENTMIQNANGIKMVDLVDEVGFEFLKSIKDLAQPISLLMMGK